MLRYHCLAVFTLLAGCASADAPELATPIIDTLPSGATLVMNPGPTAWADTSGWCAIV